MYPIHGESGGPSRRRRSRLVDSESDDPGRTGTRTPPAIVSLLDPPTSSGSAPMTEAGRDHSRVRRSAFDATSVAARPERVSKIRRAPDAATLDRPSTVDASRQKFAEGQDAERRMYEYLVARLGMGDDDDGTSSSELSMDLVGGVGGQAALLPMLSLGMSMKPSIKLSGSVSYQDDRKFRAGVTLSCGLGFELKVGPATMGDESNSSRSLVGVWPSMENFVRYVCNAARIIAYELSLPVRGAVGDKAATRTELGRLRSVNQKQGASIVTARTDSAGNSIDVLGLASAGASESSGIAHFYKTRDNPDPSKGGERQLVSAVSSTDSRAGSFGVTFPGVGTVEGVVTETTIRGHPNPDNDGTYFNLSVGFDSDNPVIVAFLAGLEKFRNFRTKDGNLQSVCRAIVEIARQSGTATFSSFVTSIADVKELPAMVNVISRRGFVREWNYVAAETGAGTDDGPVRLQYRRDSGTSTTAALAEGSAEGAENLGPATFSAGGTIANSTRRMMTERLGEDSFTYVETVFNGYMWRQNFAPESGGTEPLSPAWKRFVDSHREQLWSMCASIAAAENGSAADRGESGLWAELKSSSSSGAAAALRSGLGALVPADSLPSLSPAFASGWQTELERYLRVRSVDTKKDGGARFRQHIGGVVRLRYDATDIARSQEPPALKSITVFPDKDSKLDAAQQALLKSKTPLELMSEHRFAVAITLETAQGVDRKTHKFSFREMRELHPQLHRLHSDALFKAHIVDVPADFVTARVDRDCRLTSIGELNQGKVEFNKSLSEMSWVRRQANKHFDEDRQGLAQYGEAILGTLGA